MTKETTDFSVTNGFNVAPASSALLQKLLSNMTEQLQRIINFPACEKCSAVRAVMSFCGSQWDFKDGPLMLPDRVLEILDMESTETISLRLLETGGSETGAYIAFSHRWGGSLSLKTTKSTLLRRIEGFTLADLPRTFRDAVLVAKALGIRYIWIDSLCIIQDDREDWLKQSAKMGLIYMNSTFTIAAHSAGQCNEGFLWRSQVSSTLSISPQRGGPDFLVSIPDIDDRVLQTRFLESEISRRAWILQELTLSPRILHFVEDRLFWECEHLSPEISGSEVKTTAGIFIEGLGELGRGGSGGVGAHAMWLKLIEKYSNYQMTKSDDKLVAVAGIVDVLRKRIEDVADREYHCGIFQEDIVRSLLWYAPGVVQLHLERAPSWSWASIDGKILFLSLELSEPPKTLIKIQGFQHYDYLGLRGARRGTLGSITNAVCHGSRTRTTESQSGCHLIVQAPIISITSHVTVEKSKKIRNTPREAPRWMTVMLKDRFQRTTYAWCLPDKGLFPDSKKVESNDLVTLSFLAVSGREISGELVGAWCIIISTEDTRFGTYRRVGLGYIRDMELITPSLVAPEIITLV